MDNRCCCSWCLRHFVRLAYHTLCPFATCLSPERLLGLNENKDVLQALLEQVLCFFLTPPFHTHPHVLLDSCWV